MSDSLTDNILLITLKNNMPIESSRFQTEAEKWSSQDPNAPQ